MMKIGALSFKVLIHNRCFYVEEIEARNDVKGLDLLSVNPRH